MSDVDASRARLASTDITGQELADIAANHPGLRVLVAAHPAAYPSLLAWLGALGDPAVDAILAARTTSANSSPAAGLSAHPTEGSAPGVPAAPTALPPRSPDEPSPQTRVPGSALVGKPTDGISIAALVTGVLGMGLVPLVLGVVGLNRTRRNGTRGRGMSITGIVLGVVAMVVASTLVILAVWYANPKAPVGSGQGVPAAHATWFQYEPTDKRTNGKLIAATAKLFGERLSGAGADAQVTVKGKAIRVTFSAPPDPALVSSLTQPLDLNFRPVLTTTADPGPAEPTATSSETSHPAEPSSPSDTAFYLTAVVQDELARLDCTGNGTASLGAADQPLVACAVDSAAKSAGKFALGPVELTGDSLSQVTVGPQTLSNGMTGTNLVVNLTFDANGARLLNNVTSRLTGLFPPQDEMAAVAGGLVVSAPTVQSAIPDGQMQMSFGSDDDDAIYRLGAQLGFGRPGMTWQLTSSGS